MKTRLRVARAALAAAVLTLGGCDDDEGTAPETTGRAQAIVTDAPSGSAAALAPAGEAGPRFAVEAGSYSYSGTVTADAQVSISADGQTWVDIGPASSISLALQSSGDSTDVHGAVDVPVGTYAYVRLVMDDANARVNAGSSIGGLLLTAAVDVGLGTGGRVVVVKEVQPFIIHADTRTTLIFDLNSEAWMTEANAGDKQVEEEEVEESCEARTRSEPEPEQA